MRIIAEHHEVRELARRDRALQRLFLRVPGAVQRVDAQGLVHGDPLIAAPDLAVPALAGGHGLQGHHRREGAGVEVRSRTDLHPCVEQVAIGHDVAHQGLAIEVELVPVVVGVGAEERRRHVQRLHAGDQVRIQKGAVGNLPADVLGGDELCGALIGGQHVVDGDVAIGVTIHPESGPVHALDKGVQRLLVLGDIAAIAGPAGRIGRGEGHGALGEGAVGHVLGRGADADPLIPHAGPDTRLQQ